MSGHYICDRCGYEGGYHADYCVYLRPMNERWKGNRTKAEMEELKAACEASALPSTKLDGPASAPSSQNGNTPSEDRT